MRGPQRVCVGGVITLRKRLRRARVRFRERDAELSEAVAATGYASRSHFARHFRRAFGISPAEARKRRGKATTA